MTDKIYDTAIIGTGPAGLSSILTLNVHNKSIAWFGLSSLSDKVNKAHKIINLAGFNEISGKELNDRFMFQIKENNLEIINKMVTLITKDNEYFMILADNEIYKAKTILLAIGAVTSKGILNEENFLGRGVSYCATCDGFLYKDKTISIYISNPHFENEVKYLASLASKVYLYTAYKADININNVIKVDKPFKEIIGDKKVKQIKLADDTLLDIDGAFFIRDSISPKTIFEGLKMNNNDIEIDRSCKTNIEGIYAAGDITGRPYQIAKAIGEGNIAAHSILDYLDNKEV